MIAPAYRLNTDIAKTVILSVVGFESLMNPLLTRIFDPTRNGVAIATPIKSDGIRTPDSIMTQTLMAKINGSMKLSVPNI